MRKEFLKERKAMRDMMKEVTIERLKNPSMREHGPDQGKKKLEIDPAKLERTIQKACVPIVKKSIVVISEIPNPKTAAAPTPVVIAICAAKNLNGTPCKCRAKIGKFCAKHAA